jgi:hypothetical protein
VRGGLEADNKPLSPDYRGEGRRKRKRFAWFSRYNFFASPSFAYCGRAAEISAEVSALSAQLLQSLHFRRLADAKKIFAGSEEIKPRVVH